MRKYSIILLLLISSSLSAQQMKIDSLEALLPQIKDEEKVILLNNLSESYLGKSPDKALEYGKQALVLGESSNNKKETACAQSNIGSAYTKLSNYERALEYHTLSLDLWKEIENNNEIAASMNNIGIIYGHLGIYDKALEYFLNSRKIYEEIEDKLGIAESLNSIAIIYYDLSNFINALEYFKESLEIRNEIGDKTGIARSLNNVGVLYKELKEYNTALEYYEKSLTLKEELGNKKDISSTLNNIGVIYADLSKYDTALEYLLKSLRIKEELGNKAGIANTLNYIGSIYIKLHDYTEARLTLERSVKLSEEINAKELMKNGYSIFSDFYIAQDDYEKALDYYRLFSAVKDSIFNNESSGKIAEMQTRFETEKKEREIEILTRDKAIGDLELKRQQIIKYMSFAGSALLFVFVILLFNRNRLKQRGTEIIQKQKEELEKRVAERTKELSDLNKNLQNEIYENKKAEEERIKLEEQLFQAQKMDSIGRLAGGIAHDFNNILTGILGYAEILRMKFDDSSDYGKAITVIMESAEKAADLTKQLLSLARHDKYNPVPINLNDLIKKTVNVSEKIFEKSIDVVYNFCKDIHTVEVDKNQIDQVLTNLIINAKDAMPNGGKLSFETENVFLPEYFTDKFPELNPGDFVRISIADTGTGIPKKIKTRIFEPFFTTKGEGDGTGLGLSMVYSIIKNHNGHINCYSESGKGTVFTIYLPTSEKEVVEAKEEKTILGDQETILVVDDEKHIRNLIINQLQQLGYKILAAEGGVEAVKIYQKNQDIIELVLLDMIMPNLSGKETFLELKKINPEVKVIIVSGFSQDVKAKEILNEGAREFVQKPFKLHDLARIIHNTLKK